MAASQSLSIKTSDLPDGGWSVQLAGELDIATAPQLISMFDTDRPVVIDLSQLTFMDSTGLSALLAISGSCEKLRLVLGPTPVQRIFEITKTEERFDWVSGPGQHADPPS